MLSFLRRAIPSSGSEAEPGLSTVLRSLGAIGEPGPLLPAPILREALVSAFREAGTLKDDPMESGDFRRAGNPALTEAPPAVVPAVAKEVDARRKLGPRNFEEWIAPAGSPDEVKELLADLVEEGPALGLGVGVRMPGERLDGEQPGEGEGVIAVDPTRPEPEGVTTAAGRDPGEGTSSREGRHDSAARLALPGEASGTTHPPPEGARSDLSPDSLARARTPEAMPANQRDPTAPQQPGGADGSGSSSSPAVSVTQAFVEGAGGARESLALPVALPEGGERCARGLVQERVDAGERAGRGGPWKFPSTPPLVSEGRGEGDSAHLPRASLGALDQARLSRCPEAWTARAGRGGSGATTPGGDEDPAPPRETRLPIGGLRPTGPTGRDAGGIRGTETGAPRGGVNPAPVANIHSSGFTRGPKAGTGHRGSGGGARARGTGSCVRHDRRAGVPARRHDSERLEHTGLAGAELVGRLRARVSELELVEKVGLPLRAGPAVAFLPAPCSTVRSFVRGRDGITWHAKDRARSTVTAGGPHGRHLPCSIGRGNLRAYARKLPERSRPPCTRRNPRPVVDPSQRKPFVR